MVVHVVVGPAGSVFEVIEVVASPARFEMSVERHNHTLWRICRLFQQCFDRVTELCLKFEPRFSLVRDVMPLSNPLTPLVNETPKVVSGCRTFDLLRSPSYNDR